MEWIVIVGVSPSKKIVLYASMKALLKWWKMLRNEKFILKAFFTLKMFKFLSWPFGQVEKTAWLKIHGY